MLTDVLQHSLLVCDLAKLTFNDVCFVLDLVLLIIDTLLNVFIVVDDVLSHSEVVAYDCLRTIVYQRATQKLKKG